MKMSPIKAEVVPADWAVETILPVAFEGGELSLEAYAFQDEGTGDQILTVVHRGADVGKDTVPLVRVHSGCVTGDIFHSLRCDCYQQLQASLKAISDVSLGAIVYVPYHEGRGIGLFKKMQTYALQDRGRDTVDANLEIGSPVDSRDYSLVARALRHLDMERITLLSNNPAKQEALEALGIEVAERRSIVVPANKFNSRYLKTKRDRMSHKI